MDIYGRHRYIDFALESPESKIAIEIDGETYHNPSKVSENKYADDLLKQNSLIYDNWKVYRWIYSQLEKQPEKVKDELITFLGSSPMFKAFEADLPTQMGQDHRTSGLPAGSHREPEKGAERWENHRTAVPCDRRRKNDYSCHGCKSCGWTNALSGQCPEAGFTG